MIQVMLKLEETEAIAQFLLACADETGKPIEEIAQAEMTEGFQKRVGLLHERFASGEFSLGDFANDLGVSRVALIHILSAMKLAVANV